MYAATVLSSTHAHKAEISKLSALTCAKKVHMSQAVKCPGQRLSHARRKS